MAGIPKRLLAASLLLPMLSACPGDDDHGTSSMRCAAAAEPDCGEHVWSKSFGPGLASGWVFSRTVAFGADGRLVFAGDSTTSDPIDFGAGPIPGEPGLFVAAFDPAGDPAWAKRFDISGGPHATNVLANPAGNTLVQAVGGAGAVDFGSGPIDSAVVVALLDSAGDEVWSVGIDGSGSASMTARASGNPIVLAGGTARELDRANGAELWNHSAASDCDPTPTQGMIAVDGSGNTALVVIDACEGPPVRVLQRLDPAGELVWEIPLEGALAIAAMAADADGNITVAGTLLEGGADLGGGTLANAGNMSILYVAQFDADGAHRWSNRYGVEMTCETGQDCGRSFAMNGLAIGSTGDIFLSGNYGRALDFGGGALTEQDGFFIAHLGRDGEHLWSRVYAAGLIRNIAADGGGGFALAGLRSGPVPGLSGLYLSRFGP